MADISNEIAVIRTAEYGEEVRSSICDAIEKINNGGSGPSPDSNFFAGAVKQNVNGGGCVLNDIKGTPEPRSMQEYKASIPRAVYDAVNYMCENYSDRFIDLDTCQFLYVKQGKLRAMDMDSFYTIILLSNGASIDATVTNINQVIDTMYPNAVFYNVRNYTGSFWVITISTSGDLSTIGIGEATSEQNYTFTKAFHNCVNSTGETTYQIPLRCHLVRMRNCSTRTGGIEFILA
jgi:hypothetical protein